MCTGDVGGGCQGSAVPMRHSQGVVACRCPSGSLGGALEDAHGLRSPVRCLEPLRASLSILYARGACGPGHGGAGAVAVPGDFRK